DSQGRQANNYSRFPSISANGQYVAFASTASNLVSGDTNNHQDIFVNDRGTGETIRVSVDWQGTQGNDDSAGASIAAAGSAVAFASSATSLVPGDYLLPDVFAHSLVEDCSGDGFTLGCPGQVAIGTYFSFCLSGRGGGHVYLLASLGDGPTVTAYGE